MSKIISIVMNNFINDSRVLKECISYHKAGLNVKVLALYEDGLKESEFVRGIQVVRSRLVTKRLPKTILFQTIKYFEFLLKVLIGTRNVDFIHCNDLAPLPIAVLIKMLSRGKIKIIYDAHEFETETHGLSGWKKTFARRLEGSLIKYTDQVITVSEGIAVEYSKLYKIPKPKLVLNCPYYQNISKNNIFRDKFGISKETKIFLYQGGLTKGRGIEILIQAFEQVKRDDIALVLMGYGPLRELVESFAAKKNNKIYYHEAVKPDELLSYTSSADIGVTMIENTCLSYYYCLPNKLFEYAMAGLPVLVSNLPEMERVVRSFDVGEVIGGNSIELIKKGIEKMASTDLSKYINNTQELVKHYNWENQERELLSLVCGGS